MEDLQPTKPIASLRPHHALCVLFFEGKGYSEAFVESMTAFLADPGRMCQLTAGCDVLCQDCHHNQSGICDDEDKVSLFDERALNFIGALLHEEQPILLNELCQFVNFTILQQGMLGEICEECEWAALCQDKWRRGDFNSRLLQPESKSL